MSGYDRRMRKIAAAAVALFVVLGLTACSSTDDKKACTAYVNVIGDWVAKGSDTTKLKDVADTLRTQVAPEASAPLAAAVKVMADQLEATGAGKTAGQAADAAGATIKKVCDAAGVTQ